MSLVPCRACRRLVLHLAWPGIPMQRHRSGLQDRPPTARPARLVARVWWSASPLLAKVSHVAWNAVVPMVSKQMTARPAATGSQRRNRSPPAACRPATCACPPPATRTATRRPAFSSRHAAFAAPAQPGFTPRRQAWVGWIVPSPAVSRSLPHNAPSPRMCGAARWYAYRIDGMLSEEQDFPLVLTHLTRRRGTPVVIKEPAINLAGRRSDPAPTVAPRTRPSSGACSFPGEARLLARISHPNVVAVLQLSS